MAREWKCHKCGEPAEYKSGKKAYCEQHWVEYMFVPKAKKRKREDVYVGLIIGMCLGLAYWLCVATYYVFRP